MAITIAQASVFIEELLEVLENVYWESNSINIKNQCFNAVRLLQGELTELTKVSIQDHHYEYEIISCSSSVMLESVMQLNTLLENEALRIRTSGQLTPLMEQAGQIYK